VGLRYHVENGGIGSRPTPGEESPQTIHGAVIVRGKADIVIAQPPGGISTRITATSAVGWCRKGIAAYMVTGVFLPFLLSPTRRRSKAEIRCVLFYARDGFARKGRIRFRAPTSWISLDDGTSTNQKSRAIHGKAGNRKLLRKAGPMEEWKSGGVS